MHGNKFGMIKRWFCQQTSIKDSIKCFDEIPGTKGSLGIGTFIDYLPIIGKYKFDMLHKSGLDLYQKYGSIVRETIVPGLHIIWLFDPDDFSKLLTDTPGLYPERESHSALEKYRKDRTNVYNNGGLLPTNGSEWFRIRSEFQRGLSAPASVRNFLPETNLIVKEFVANIKSSTALMNENEIQDFLPDLSRLNLELVCYLIFDVRMNGFSEEEQHPNSRTSKLIESAEITNSLILPLEQGLKLWKYFPTTMYKKFADAQEFMESVAIDLVTKKKSQYNTTESKTSRIGSRPLLEEYLKNSKIDQKDIVGMAADLLLGGIDTTSYTTSFVLYHLAKNPDVQNKLYQETCELLPHYLDDIDTEKLNQARYTKAVLKESLRLNPISVGIGRILTNDKIFSGYLVPKNTTVVTHNFVACRLDKNFDDPEQFIPERWLTRNRDGIKIKTNDVHPFLVTPFGHGMRACIARRMAEQNMIMTIIRLIRKYQIEWCGTEYMDVKSIMINKPDQPVKIKFNLRKDCYE